MSGSSTFDCYVANLPLHYYENDIREIFGVAGEIVGVKVLAAKHGAEGKVAFVKFTSESDAHCCAQYMNNHMLDDGRQIKVRYRPLSQENGVILPNSVVKPNEQSGSTGYSSGIKVPYEDSENNPKVESNGNGKLESKQKFDTRNNYMPYEDDFKQKVESNGNGKLESKQKFDTRNNYIDDMMQVLVSHVESPIEFWAQPCSQESAVQLEDLTDTMEKKCPTQTKVIGQLSTEQMYGCKFSEDNLWYRCIVEKSLAKNEVHVRYIDYGNAEVTNRFGLVTLPNSVANVPPLCECYQLEGLELVSNDPQSEIFDKGLEELSDLINEEKIYLKIIKKEKNATVVKVYEDSDGAPLDVLSVLTPSGSVRSKTVGHGPSWATAVKKTGVAHTTPQNTPPKSNHWSAAVNGNEPTVKPASNHVKPSDSHVKPLLNHGESIVKPVPNHVKPTDSHAKPLVNHTKPIEIPSKATYNQVKCTDSPAKSIIAHVEHLESLEASLNHFSAEQPSKVVTHPPPGFHEQVKPKPEVVTLKEIVKEEEEEEVVVPEQSVAKNLPTQRRLYSETESTSSVNSEVCKENDDNSADIIEQLKIQLAEKTILLENYRQRSLSTSTSASVGVGEAASSSENRCVENLLSTDSRVVGSLYIPGEEDSKQDLTNIPCENTVIGHIDMENDDSLNEIDVPKVACKNIGGYKKEIAEIKGLVDLSLNHVDLFDNMGIKPPRGILLCGPHGTGKTLIARAIANESHVFLKEIFGPSLVSASPEVSSRKLTKAFTEVMKNAPSVLIIDQIDVIAPKRKEGVKNKLLARLLTQLNQLRNNTILICTANRSSSLDPALKRIGLFAKEVTINKPDETNRLEILRVLTKDLELSKGLCLSKLAQETREYTGLNLTTFCTLATTHALDAKINSISPNKNKELGSLKRLTIKSGDFKFALAQMNSSLHKAVVEIPNTTWNDVCGMEVVKNELKDLINHSHSYEEKLLDFGCVPSKGILLYGPHGCGKKLLAKAMSNECKCNFMCVKGYELSAFESTFDENSCNVADIFAKARKYAPCMLYIEEIDLVTPSNNLVKEMLMEIDSIGDKENVYVIGATNRPSQVHPAFRYSGRLHNLVHIPLPDDSARKSILEQKMKNISKSKKIDANYLERIAKTLEGFNISDLQKIVYRVSKTKDADVVSFHHFEEALRYVRPSVTHADIEECSTFIMGVSKDALITDTTNTNNEAVSSLLEHIDAAAAGTEFTNNANDVKHKNAIPNGLKNYVIADVSKTNYVIPHDTMKYVVLLGLFIIACLIYFLIFYIYSNMKYQ